MESWLPKITVVVRTVGRAHLEEALASVRAQALSPSEVVVVDASGKGESPPKVPQLPLRWLSPGRPLSRPEAANAGLLAAVGELVAFLDEDDLWLPSHLECLVRVLAEQPAAVAAYSAARAVDAQGAMQQRFGYPFDPLRLALGNFIPLHTVLFRRRAVEAGCRFDESLSALEDWDFFLQLAEQGPLVFCPEETAIYRALGTSEAGLLSSPQEIGRWRQAVYGKWVRRWTRGRLEELVLLLDREVTARDEVVAHLRGVERALEEREKLLQEIIQSRSWRWTKFFRRWAAFLRKS